MLSHLKQWKDLRRLFISTWVRKRGHSDHMASVLLIQGKKPKNKLSLATSLTVWSKDTGWKNNSLYFYNCFVEVKTLKTHELLIYVLAIVHALFSFIVLDTKYERDNINKSVSSYLIARHVMSCHCFVPPLVLSLRHCFSETNLWTVHSNSFIYIMWQFFLPFLILTKQSQACWILCVTSWTF